MTRSRFIAMGLTCLLAVVLFIAPSMEAITGAIGDVAESSMKSLTRPLWPFAHGKCFNLDRFDPTCPHCL
jgi:hypothetical protein